MGNSQLIWIGCCVFREGHVANVPSILSTLGPPSLPLPGRLTANAGDGQYYKCCGCLFLGEIKHDNGSGDLVINRARRVKQKMLRLG